VLLYASFLAKEYDVLAIAVSGENADHLLISHFVYLKGLSNHSPYFSDKILSCDQYYDGIMHSNIKFNQDYTELIKYTKTLNDELHVKKIKESQRALLISGILIALRNDAFKTGYKEHHTAKSMVNSLYATIGTELDQSDIPDDRVTKLKGAFSFVKSNTSLTDPRGGG
jgi:hypothetical protein